MNLLASGTQSGGEAIRSRKFTKYESALVVLFVLTLPLCNPWVRGDGVGYYAFARSILIEHRLDFANDWLHSNASFRMGRIDAEGHINADQYTATGRLDNHFSVGPAILWSPFLILAHAGVLLYDHFGGKIAADGFSRPYLVAMALGTAVYGFLAILISFALARKFVPESWAFLAALGIWFGSPLPVYMYFNPSWSHAHAAFAVALFLWYWIRTRGSRAWWQWAILGAIGGLMMDAYYINAILLLIPLCESAGLLWSAFKNNWPQPIGAFVLNNIAFCVAIFLALLPTLFTKKIIYGSYLNFGYTEHWFWKSPAFFRVCFSSEHGLFSWTPILALAVVGLVFLRERDRTVALYLLMAFVSYVYALGCYQNWHGISSYGSRFFVALTAVFVIGLAAFFDWFARAWQGRRAAVSAASATAILVLWNLGLIFQWGLHWIPERGPVSWRAAAYNQVAVVPEEAASILKAYLTGRSALMDRIEQRDVQQLKSQGAK
ncbi:MAG TPA: hypothetical protein VGR97_03945 [Candidatus Acidoferrales bacterium]|nr:hypothetical protein [Candidatus Acidoferrales bacterium]